MQDGRQNFYYLNSKGLKSGFSVDKSYMHYNLKIQSSAFKT